MAKTKKNCAKTKTPDHHFIDLALGYGADFKNRVLHLDFEITEYEIQNFTRSFKIMEASSSDPITVVINCTGGTIYDGLYLYDLIRLSKCKVIIEGWGSIMSMATFVLCAGDDRYLAPNATVMVHELSTWIAGELTDLKIELKEAKRLEHRLISIYCERTNKKDKKFWSRFKKSKYFSAEEAINMGMAHKVLEYPAK